MRKGLSVVIIVLLALIVGYLALDRHEKNVQKQRAEEFDNRFAR
jgi:hypothetical protein